MYKNDILKDDSNIKYLNLFTNYNNNDKKYIQIDTEILILKNTKYQFTKKTGMITYYHVQYDTYIFIIVLSDIGNHRFIEIFSDIINFVLF